MSKDGKINVRPFMETAVWSDGWISNGHFAVSKARVRLGDRLTSDDAVQCAYPKAERVTYFDAEKIAEVITPKGELLLFRRTDWANRESALFLGPNGQCAWFAVDYVDTFKVDELYGPSTGDGAYFSATSAEDNWLTLMPKRVAAAWDDVARAAAHAARTEAA